MEWILYIAVGILVVIVFYCIYKESNKEWVDSDNIYNKKDSPFSEKEISFENHVHVVTKENTIKPLTWEDYDKSLDIMMNNTIDSINVTPLNGESEILFKENDDKEEVIE